MRSKPAFELRRGLIKVRVVRKRTKSGLRHTVTVTRLFKDGDIWKESTRFGRDDIPLVRLVLDQAFVWIYQNSAEPTP
ncbi:MAG TPA: hypothetical protein VGI40_16230 [Pirellulaceae bacterium]|jgi:hypothetical protein